MAMTRVKPENVTEYIAVAPKAAQKHLNEMRALIKKVVPAAEEVISYGMPGYRLNGMLVWFAGYERHVGVYPKPSAILHFKKELSSYKQSKGAVQFPLDAPLPKALIRDMIVFRLEENSMKAKK